MASEYLKWLARNEKPDMPKELTPEEKRKNWWYYNKWYVFIALGTVFLALYLCTEIAVNLRNPPDLEVAYIGSSNLRNETAEFLEMTFESLSEDINGDGKIVIRINQYILPEDMDKYTSEDVLTQELLIADITMEKSFLFLMEDPAFVQQIYGVLSLSDGTYPEYDKLESGNFWIAWKNCPRLSDMAVLFECNDNTLDMLYIGRRGFVSSDTDMERIRNCDEVWNKIIEDTKME